MSSNVIFMIVAGIVVLVLLLWLLAASRRTKVEIEARPSNETARRNQALIDAAPAAGVVPAAMPDVPVAVAPVIDSGAAAGAAPLHMPAAVEGDDLTRLKGVGPKLAEQLRALGVTRFAQIAAWDDSEIDRIDSQLGRFQGRIRRDDWPAQARFLESGDTAGYEAKFGRL